MIGVVIAIVMLLFVLQAEERRRLRKILPLVIVLILGSMVLLNFGEFVARFTAISEPTREGSAAYRVFEIYNVWHMVLERPIFGWPMGTNIRNYTLVDLPVFSSLMPHNIYLYVLYRGGIFGLIAWIGLLVALVRMHYRTIRAASTPLERFLSLWLACGTLVIIMAGFTAAIWNDHLQHFYPFLVVMASFLPGSWPRRKLEMLRAGQFSDGATPELKPSSSG
jgi:O-antigen ligase